MEVLKLMNSNPNWRNVLSAAPYNITIKEDGDFILLKYSQIESDFNLPIVRECRGAIFVCENGVWRCVRRAFDKFGNYGESYVPKINWFTALVQEKIDGSLMSVWNYKDKWYISTNGTIDAFKAPLGDFNLTFGDYFITCLGCDYSDFLATLDPNFCYTYEMVGPLNRVVISYEKERLYAIGQRDMRDLEEWPYCGPLGEDYNIYKPTLYPIVDLEGAIAAANMMSKDEEGFVVCDLYFNRVKVKSPEYLMAARLHNNGVITTKRLIEIILTEKVDDFIAYCPVYENCLREVENKIKKLIERIRFELLKVGQLEKPLNRAEYAKFIKDFKYKHFLFGVYDGKYSNAKDYVYSLRIEQIEKMI